MAPPGLFLTLFLAFCITASAQRLITTVAGTDKTFPPGGVNALNAPLSPWGGSAIDSAGNYYFIDNSVNKVLKLTPNGQLTLVAGNGLRSFSGDSGPATKAALAYPYAVAVDNNGHLLIADQFNFRIRRVDANTGIITTIAGSGNRGCGAGGPALTVPIGAVQGIAVDSANSIFIADTECNVIRKISGGTMTTVVGNGTAGFLDNVPAANAQINAPRAIVIDPSNNLYIADTDNDVIRRVSANTGTITTIAGTRTNDFNGDNIPATTAHLAGPRGLALDSAGSLYIADFGNHRIRKVTGNTITTVAGGGPLTQRTQYGGFSGDNGLATNADISFPSGISVNSAGHLLILDGNNNRIRRVSGGTITTIAGNTSAVLVGENVPATASILHSPFGVAVDRQGNLYVADTSGQRVRKVSASGVITNFAGTGTPGYSGDNGPATAAALNNPESVAVDASGNVYIADTINAVVRKVRPDGIITTVAGTGVHGYSGDGRPATQSNMVTPEAVAVDPNGIVYIADTGNRMVRRITPEGLLVDVLEGFGNPAGMVFDSTGALYVSDSDLSAIFKYDRAGNITVAVGTGDYGFSPDGTAARSASLRDPTGLAIDSAGNLIFADAGNSMIRMVTSAGVLATIAGTGVDDFGGDGGPANQARLSVHGLAIDSRGTIFFADTSSNRARAVLAVGPSFSAAPTSLSFSSRSGDAPTAFQNVGLASIAGVSYTLQISDPWIEVTPAAGLMPAILQVKVNPGSLEPGNYQGRITIIATGASPPSLQIPVNATIAAGKPAELSVDSPGLRFSLVAGNAPAQQQLVIKNEGSSNFRFNTAVELVNGSNWLSATASANAVTAASPGTVTVTVNPQELAPGTYTGAIPISSNAGNARIPVTLTLAPAGPKIFLSQTGLSFQVLIGGTALPKSFAILNAGQGQLNWTASSTTFSGGSWLSINESTGNIAAGTGLSTIEVSVNSAGLQAGRHYGQISVSGAGVPNSPQILSVILNVLPVGSTLSPEVSPASLIFIGAPGQNPSSQDVLISNSGFQALTYISSLTLADGSTSIRHLPNSGSLAAGGRSVVTVQPDFARQGGGIRTSQLGIQFSDGSVQTVRIVTVSATGSPTSSAPKDLRTAAVCAPIKVAPDSESSITATVGQPVRLSIKVVDGCGVPVTENTLLANATFSNGDPNLRLTHSGGGKWEATYPIKNGQVNQIRTSITVFVPVVSGPPLADQIDLAITLGAAADTPLIDKGRVLNGASFSIQAPLVAPGSYISIFGSKLGDDPGQVAPPGPLPSQLRNARVLLGSRELALNYVGNNQINAQVPFDLPENTELPISVRHGTTASVAELVSIAPAQPGIFTVSQNGSGQGAITNAVTNAVADGNAPVRAGDIIAIYCTGLGKVDADLKAGDVAPRNPLARTIERPTVLIGGREARVDFSGLAPDYVGLYQVNAIVPEGLTPGSARVEVIIAGQRTPVEKIVTIEVR